MKEGIRFIPGNCGESFLGEMTICILNDKEVLRRAVMVIMTDTKTLAYM